MVLGPRLDLRQSQSLVMTPQLQQAIKLLQLSNIELAEFVAEVFDSASRDLEEVIAMLGLKHLAHLTFSGLLHHLLKGRYKNACPIPAEVAARQR